MTETVDFKALGLSEQMLEAVKAKGFELPTSVQKLTIPRLLNNTNDMIAQSQTGTGKTAAYGLPILQQIDPSKDGVKAIVLVPTRELAIQVTEELLSYNKERKLSIAAIYGGASISEQLRRLAKGIDIVVGTPGRVLDHIRRKTLDLSGVRYLILDEADEMLNMGFIEDIEDIMSNMPPEKRVLLFSATMPDRIVKLSKKYMHATEILRVESQQLTADLTDQIYFEVRESDKFDALTRIIDVTPEFYGIVFSRTKVGVDELVNNLLERGYAAEGLHGDVSQTQREKILRKFKKKQANILVATDVAARGIDINNLSHVINYSLPQDSESYVHRIGRTGRAGNQGTAITFISNSEMRQFGFLKRDIKVEIKKEKLPTAQDVVAIKRNRIKDELQDIVNGDNYADYGSMAEEILSMYTPEVALSALLRLAFRSELDENNYPEIRSFSVDRKGTARLFIAIGRAEGYDVRKLVSLLKSECGLKDSMINDVRLMDDYSFVSVPFSDAEHVVRKLNAMRSGGKPLAEIAKPEGGDKGGRGEGRSFKSEDRGGRGDRRDRREGRSDRADRGERSERAPRGERIAANTTESRGGLSRREKARQRDVEAATNGGGSSFANEFAQEERGARSKSADRVKNNNEMPGTTGAAYSPNNDINDTFDWSIFDMGGNSWGRSDAKRSRSTDKDERPRGGAKEARSPRAEKPRKGGVMSRGDAAKSRKSSGGAKSGKRKY